MNNQDRKQLDEAIDLLEQAKAIIESISEQEQEKFDNLSENLQQSEKGQRFEEVSSELADVVSNLEEAIDAIENVK